MTGVARTRATFQKKAGNLFLKKKSKMATKKTTFTEKDGALGDLKEKISAKEKLRKKDAANLSKKKPKKACHKTKESKEKFDKHAHKQQDQCLDSPSSTLEGNEVFGQPIPELYPELSEELEGPMDVGLADENSNKQEPLPFSSLQIKEQGDDSQNSSDDSQLIGVKKRRKMLIPKKFERKLKVLDSDDDEEFPVLDPTHEPEDKPKEKDAPEKQPQRTGSWVQCSLPHCGKWRCLNDKGDPNNLPDKWVCSMNPDGRYNRCQASQEDFDSQDEEFDVVYSPYPEGAIVWAKLGGYPWWPGMMEDDPDYGYYCETDENTREPISYHVVFFDKDVSRAWVNTCNVRLFQADDNPEDQGNVVIRKKNFKKKLDLAAEQAKQALSLPPENRLKVYGFARRFRGPIGQQNKQSKVDKKTKLMVEEEETEEEIEEGNEENDEDYLNSAESNEYSESSENFSEEFCKKTKKRQTPTKKTRKATAEPANELPNKGCKKENDKKDKSEANTAIKTAVDKAKKNSKPRKRSTEKNEKAAKMNCTEKGKKTQHTPVAPMSGVSEVTKDAVTSLPSSESPKSPIPSSHDVQVPFELSSDVSKETAIKEKTKTKKRKLGDKKSDGPEKKEKTPRKESKQTEQKEKSVKPAKKTAKMTATNKRKTQENEGQAASEKMAALESPFEEENCTMDHESEGTVTEDVQIPNTVPVQPSSTASSSLQFANMPKLIKAGFRPPSKKCSESNTSFPKPMKMPKLWKPQFVCPAVAAAEKASDLLKCNKKAENNCQSGQNDHKQAELEVKRSFCDDQERISIADKRPSLQIKAAQNDPSLRDEVEVELAKLDRDIEDMKKEFKSSINTNEELPLKGLEFTLCTEVKDLPKGHGEELGKHRESDGHVDVLTTIPSPQEFWHNYASIRKPVIFRGAAKNFPAHSLWTDNYLKKNYGSLEVKLEAKKEKDHVPVGDRGLGRDTITSFLDTYTQKDSYMVSQLPDPLAKEVRVLPCLMCGTFSERILEANLWLSSGGTKSMLHKDADNAINCLLNGTKNWILIHPDNEENIPVAEGDKGYGGFAVLDVDQVNLLKYPNFTKVHWQYANMTPGDCLYLPYSYWHQVRSYGSKNMAVSVLFSRLTKFNSTGCETAKLEYTPLSDINMVWTYPGHGPQTMGNLDPFEMKHDYLTALNAKEDGRITVDDLFQQYSESKLYEDHPEIRKQIAQKVIGILDPDNKGFVTRDDVETFTVEKLKAVADIVDPDAANTEEYEHVVFGVGEVRNAFEEALEEGDGVLTLEKLIVKYQSLGGSEKVSRELFAMLRSKDKEYATREEVENNLSDVLELYKKIRDDDKSGVFYEQHYREDKEMMEETLKEKKDTLSKAEPREEL